CKSGRCRLTESGTRRIKNNQVRPFIKLFHKFFRVQIVRSDGNPREFGVRSKVARCSQVCVDTDNALERFGQGQRKESHSRVQVQCERSFLSAYHRLKQFFDQESVYLEKRKMADAEPKSTGRMRQKSRPGQFEAILLLVE